MSGLASARRIRPPTPFYVAPSSIRVVPSSAQASSAGRTPARSVIRPSCPSPSLALHAHQPKCPPAASASPPAMAMPRESGPIGAIANAGAEQGVEQVRRSTHSGKATV